MGKYESGGPEFPNSSLICLMLDTGLWLTRMFSPFLDPEHLYIKWLFFNESKFKKKTVMFNRTPGFLMIWLLKVHLFYSLLIDTVINTQFKRRGNRWHIFKLFLNWHLFTLCIERVEVWECNPYWTCFRSEDSLWE